MTAGQSARDWPTPSLTFDTSQRRGGVRDFRPLGLRQKHGPRLTSTHALAETYAKDVVLFEFNPWFFNGQEELLTAFLSGLAARLEQTLDQPTAEAGKLLSKFSGLFGMIPVVGAGASKFVEQMGKEMSDKSLDNRRSAYRVAMRLAVRTVVVIIDDLDRLHRDEIMVMLKLIRLNANVPRVVYVLAFDDTMVATAIGAKYNSGPELGRQFLEKILCDPFTLPAVGRERLASMVVTQARSILL